MRFDTSRPLCGVSRFGYADSLFCGKATAVETCHWHVSKSRLSNPLSFFRKKIAPIRGWGNVLLCDLSVFGYVDSLFCGKATAVETCHWHVSKSRLSNPLSFFRKKIAPIRGWGLFFGGKMGIRTPERCNTLHDFQSCAFDQLSHLSIYAICGS